MPHRHFPFKKLRRVQPQCKFFLHLSWTKRNWKWPQHDLLTHMRVQRRKVCKYDGSKTVCKWLGVCGETEQKCSGNDWPCTHAHTCAHTHTDSPKVRARSTEILGVPQSLVTACFMESSVSSRCPEPRQEFGVFGTLENLHYTFGKC